MSPCLYKKVSDQDWLMGSKGIVPNTIAPHFRSTKATHQGKLQTKTRSDFLHLHQEDPSHLCTQDDNDNKGRFLPPDTYLGIVYVTDHICYILR